jgi:transposase-like protein
MKEPSQPNYDLNAVACPHCGSEKTENVTEEKNVDELGTPDFTKYVCNDCGENFIPAMESERRKLWSKKVRINGYNEGKSWRD